MPDWLAEPDSSLLLALAVAAVCAGVAAIKTRHKLWIGLAVCLAALAIALFVCDRVFESNREQVSRSLLEMTSAVRTQDYDVVFARVSDDFRVGGLDKAGFRKFCEERSRRWDVKEVKVWNFQLESIDQAAGTAEGSFMFKVDIPAARESFFRCKAKYVRRAGQWQMQTFTIYPPHGFDSPVAIPGLG